MVVYLLPSSAQTDFYLVEVITSYVSITLFYIYI